MWFLFLSFVLSGTSFDIPATGTNATLMLHSDDAKYNETPPRPMIKGATAFLWKMAECYIAIFAMSHFGVVMPVPIILESFESHSESFPLLLGFVFCGDIGLRLIRKHLEGVSQFRIGS